MSLNDDELLKDEHHIHGFDKAAVRRAKDNWDFSKQLIQRKSAVKDDSLVAQSNNKLVSLADMLNTLDAFFPMTTSKMDVDGFQLALEITKYKAKRDNIDPTMDDLLNAIEFLD